MNPNLNLDEKIKKIKDRISECIDYINSDFCLRCVEMHQEIDQLQKELQELNNECG